MKAQHSWLYAEMGQEVAGAAGVLGRDHPDGAKHRGGAGGEVLQVAQRGRNDVEGAGHGAKGR